MKKSVISCLLFLFALTATFGLVGCNKDNDKTAHRHAFTEQKAEQAYFASEATCTEPAKYYYSCSCGKSEGNNSHTFTSGKALGHQLGNWQTIDGKTVKKCTRNGCSYCETASQGLEYKVNQDDDTTCTITEKGTCTDKKITIPETIDGYTVTAIGEKAFKSYGIASVVIPDSVTSIAKSAFYECKHLLSVTIGSGVTFIGNSAFGGCETLVEIINNSSLNIEKGKRDNGDVAYNALNVKKGGASEIVAENDFLFYTYDNVNYLLSCLSESSILRLPENYNGQSYRIYKSAFFSSFDYSELIISAGATFIGNSSFSGNDKLRSVTIKNPEISIDKYAFAACRYLKKFIFNGTIQQWNNLKKSDDWDLYVGIENTGKSHPSYTVTCTDGTVNS